MVKIYSHVNRVPVISYTYELNFCRRIRGGGEVKRQEHEFSGDVEKNIYIIIQFFSYIYIRMKNRITSTNVQRYVVTGDTR